MSKVMIDPGHAPGCVNGGKNGYKEHAGMWKLSSYLKSALVRCGIQADLTRTENSDPSLTARGEEAKGHDLFISEHSNAGGGQGVECYYSLKRPDDKATAAKLASFVASVMNSTNRGAKTRQGTDGNTGDYYTVINSAALSGCPHVFLIENGFHDNVQDEAFLKSDVNLKKIAEAQAEIICTLLGAKYATESPVHWAEDSYTYLNNNGVKINEKRYNDPITRGEVFVLLAQIVGVSK